jgi:predicted PurR-regulated permease PerM
MIEQILAFVLGAGSVFLIWGVALAFRTARKLKSVQEELPNIYDGINTHSDELHRRIDELLKESIKHTDSRVDKLESKMDAKFNDIFSLFQKQTFEINELRQRINNTIELVNDIAGLNIKK